MEILGIHAKMFKMHCGQGFTNKYMEEARIA